MLIRWNHRSEIRVSLCASLLAFALGMAGSAMAQDANPPQPRKGSDKRDTLLGPPPVRFEPESLDLGTMKPGEKVSGTVMIHNISDKWLTVKESRASCTCTAINLANTTIAPGQAIPLDVSYSASATMGLKSNAVRILFDGYDVTEVPVLAMVALPVRSEPAYIDALAKRDGRQALSGQFIVYSMDKKPFRVLAVNGKPPEYVAFNPEKDEPANSYAIRWDVSGYDWQNGCKNAAGERMPGWFIVETDHPEAPVFDLEIRHECNRRKPATQMDNWAASDKRLLLGAVKPGETVEAQTLLKWLPKREHANPPTAVVSESPQFTVEIGHIEQHEEGLMVTLRITPAADVKGLINGTMRLHSSRQSAPLQIIASAPR